MRDRTTRRDIAALFTRQILNQKNQYIFLISNNYHESVNSLMHNKKRKSQPVSRVLSRTAIHLGCKSPCSSSNLPRNRAGHASVPLFDLAPGGVYHATSVTSCAVRSYRTFSPLPAISGRRYIFCGTFRRLAPPRHYLAPCPMEPGLSSISS